MRYHSKLTLQLMNTRGGGGEGGRLLMQLQIAVLSYLTLGYSLHAMGTFMFPYKICTYFILTPNIKRPI